MSFIRSITLTSVVAGALLAMALIPASAGAQGGTATNGGYTNLTSTSVVLHGTVNTPDPDSQWGFQYSTSPSYSPSKLTNFTAIGTGVFPVSATVTGLTPGTQYHFRLILVEGSYPTVPVVSTDGTFTTPSSSGGPPPSKAKHYGHASLQSHRLKVHGGRVAIPIKCTGTKGNCAGRLTISARGKRCASTGFRLTVRHHKTLKPGLSRACTTLLKKAAHHRLNARLHATFSTHQRPLTTGVTLIRV